MERLGLVEAIGSLRRELATAMTQAAGEMLRFEVGQIEIEFQVEVQRNAKGGVKFWVIEVGGEVSSTSTHTVRVPLTPRNSDGSPVLTRSTDEIPAVPPLSEG